MPGTKVRMVRHSIYKSGAYAYEIDVLCTDAGSLLDKSIFLYEITDLSDPKDDSFLRIAQLGDFAYPLDRDVALSQKDHVWRQDRVLFAYDNIETANAAWKEISARINALVETYDVYITEFKTSDDGTVYTYPTAAESIRNQLVKTLEEKEQALADAIKARDDKANSCARHTTDIENIQNQVNDATRDVDNYLDIQATLTALHANYVVSQAALVAGNTQIRNLNNVSDASQSQQDGIDTQLAHDFANLAILANQNTALGNILADGVTMAVATLNARLLTLTQAKNNLYNELNLCTQETTRLNAGVAAAETARDAALQDVWAVCPDYEG